MAGNDEIASNSAEKQPMVRLDIYVKRHPSLSSMEFHEFVGSFLVVAEYELTRRYRRWSKEHGILVKGWLAEKGIYRYTQVCVYLQPFRPSKDNGFSLYFSIRPF